MNRNQWIAVAVSLAFVGYIFYGGVFTSLFNQNNSQANALSAMENTGVQKEDTLNGTGDVAGAGDVVTVNYVGQLENGKVFDSSIDRNQPFTFQLGIGQVIRGWDEGVIGMRVGGKRRLVIAPDYGYGDQAVGPIPGGSTLVFDVELIGVKHAVTETQ